MSEEQPEYESPLLEVPMEPLSIKAMWRYLVWAAVHFSLLVVTAALIPDDTALAEAVTKGSPWIFLSGATAAPVLLYLWIRRDRHKQREQLLKDAELRQTHETAVRRIVTERVERQASTFRMALQSLESEYGTGHFTAIRELEDLTTVEPAYEDGAREALLRFTDRPDRPGPLVALANATVDRIDSRREARLTNTQLAEQHPLPETEADSTGA